MNQKDCTFTIAKRAKRTLPEIFRKEKMIEIRCHNCNKLLHKSKVECAIIEIKCTKCGCMNYEY